MEDKSSAPPFFSCRRHGGTRFSGTLFYASIQVVAQVVWLYIATIAGIFGNYTNSTQPSAYHC